MTPVTLLVSVGTDHHDFSRLIDYVDDWVEGYRREPTRYGGAELRYVVQHGQSRPSRSAANYTILPSGDLLDLMQTASIVVTQGGPGSIVDARACGRIPLVVPRRRYLHEVVDDHQVSFCQVMQTQGDCLVATDLAGLHVLLDRAVADPTLLVKPPPGNAAVATAAIVRCYLDSAVNQGPGWLDGTRLRETLHRYRARRSHRGPALPAASRHQDELCAQAEVTRMLTATLRPQLAKGMLDHDDPAQRSSAAGNVAV